MKGLAGLTGLGRKIALRMSLVTLAVLAISALGTFALYSWVFENFPEAVASPSAWKPQPIDYAAFAASGVIALLVAVVAGGQLARRIVIPLTSLAETARRIAEGDLSARAAAGDRSLGETADLVDDFNAMAGRLESLAESMTLWNASIAHELRTPVTILRGRLQGAADGVFAMEPAMIASLLKQVEGLGRLIEDLRVVSLADGGRLPLQPQRIDLAEVIGDLRGAVEPGLIEQGFEVEWRLAPAEAVGDPMRLQQAALALIENARRHAAPGDLVRGVLVIATDAHEDGVRLGVEDSGPGLSEAFEPFAFDPFRRASGDGEGSGLGLAVVRVIAETHGGRAAYRTGARGGSVFEIILPLNGVE